MHWINKIYRLHFQSRENRQCHVSVLAAPKISKITDIPCPYSKIGVVRSQNSSEQSCDSLLFHSLVFRKSGVLRAVNGAAWRTGSKCEDLKSSPVRMDHSPINQYFELNKSRQTFHHSLKEPHKISNIPKFHCKML